MKHSWQITGFPRHGALGNRGGSEGVFRMMEQWCRIHQRVLREGGASVRFSGKRRLISRPSRRFWPNLPRRNPSVPTGPSPRSARIWSGFGRFWKRTRFFRRSSATRPGASWNASVKRAAWEVTARSRRRCVAMPADPFDASWNSPTAAAQLFLVRFDLNDDSAPVRFAHPVHF